MWLLCTFRYAEDISTQVKAIRVNICLYLNMTSNQVDVGKVQPADAPTSAFYVVLTPLYTTGSFGIASIFQLKRYQTNVDDKYQTTQ